MFKLLIDCSHYNCWFTFAFHSNQKNMSKQINKQTRKKEATQKHICITCWSVSKHITSLLITCSSLISTCMYAQVHTRRCIQFNFTQKNFYILLKMKFLLWLYKGPHNHTHTHLLCAHVNLQAASLVTLSSIF